MTSLQGQDTILLLLGERLKQPIECFVIGGSAMLYYKAKESTKDIDIVFQTENDRQLVKKALEELDFNARSAKMLYFDKKNVPILMNRGDDRFDLFCHNIICFELSKTMMERAKKKYEYNNLICNIIAPEDIILLKCATERAGDRQDAKELIENYNIDWDVIIKEAEHQSKQDLFVVYLYDFFEELREDLKADIPKEVMKRLRKIAEKAMMALMKGKKT